MLHNSCSLSKHEFVSKNGEFVVDVFASRDCEYLIVQMLCEMLPKHLAIYDLMQLDSPAYKIHILDIQAECTGREGILQLRTPLDPCNGTCKVKRRIEKGELYLYTRDYEEASKWARELRLRCVHLLAMPENERFEVCDIPIALRQTSDPVVQTSTL